MTDVGLVLHKLQRLKAQIALTRTRRPATADVLSHDLVLRDALALAFMVALQEGDGVSWLAPRELNRRRGKSTPAPWRSSVSRTAPTSEF